MKNTREMVVEANTRTTPGRLRLRKALNSLAMANRKKARTLHCCDLCACPIEIGSEFRQIPSARVHESCFLIVNREVK